VGQDGEAADDHQQAGPWGHEHDHAEGQDGEAGGGDGQPHRLVGHEAQDPEDHSRHRTMVA
jgi:hypothetical protein